MDNLESGTKIDPYGHEIDYFDIVETPVLDGIASRLSAKCGPIGSAVKVIITIPAKNEQADIYKCLLSLFRQRNLYGRKLERSIYHIIVLCHNCTDGTVSECERFSADCPDVGLSVIQLRNPSVNNVGAVRRVAMQLANEKIPHPWGFIAMTDADTIIDPMWIANLLGYYNSDYGLICGKILTDPGQSDTSVNSLLRLKEVYSAYRLKLENAIAPVPWDPFPKHSDNSGPNMAVRAEVYERIGGMAPLGFCEDVHFYDTVVRRGYMVRHCPMTKVVTSTRTMARVPWGFGAEIGTWRRDHTNLPKVEGLGALLTRYSINAATMRYLQERNADTLRSIVLMSGIDESLILGYIDRYGSWLPVVHCIEKYLDDSGDWQKRFPMLPIREASEQLASYFSHI